ncbi:Repressible high-affinity phosphate permease [Lasiodiplodia hormozganensis]|uniref:Repressible high-affinity phosphate permease n=1 Tax=Lasiodiplodia hormozganensis TaxID=869390 RepID=A0AA40CJ48_9PEZI|nr:Repressible high-affinity phosphate permease [Lasiodiplodia hormozganensis]
MNSIHHIPDASAFTRTQQLHIIRRTIDGNSFNWLVWAVAASGFVTDSYNLFTFNVIINALYFVYWPGEDDTQKEFLINMTTLVGSIVGQIVFGIFADKFGRTRLYGVELVIVIFSTLGVASSSRGEGSMDILAWLLAWRFMMGIGIGAEYPLSAVITAEWSPTHARARMMGAVFLMQPLGQLLANLVGIGVVMGYNRNHQLDKCSDPSIADCAQQVDRIWRWVTGVGAIPALLAIVFRFLIKDPGLYELEVRNDGDSAFKNTDQVYGGGIPEPDSHAPLRHTRGSNYMMDMGEPPLPVQFSRSDLYDYFIVQGNIWYLVGTSTTWWLVDFAFYGLGMGNPRTLAKLWLKGSERDARVAALGGSVPTWNVLAPSHLYARNDGNNIYATLVEGAKRNMITVSIGSILGSTVFVMAGDYLPRRHAMTFSFVVLGALFLVTGGVIFATNDTGFHAVSIVLVGLIYFLFNLGANTLTFIIPAEIFPTRYRCVCHGISAACGKLGSVLVQWILRQATFEGVKADDVTEENLGYVFVVFGCVMLTGTLFSWAWIPEVQKKRDGRNGLRLPSKTLEELGKGMEAARAEKTAVEAGSSVVDSEGMEGVTRRGWRTWVRRV